MKSKDSFHERRIYTENDSVKSTRTRMLGLKSRHKAAELRADSGGVAMLQPVVLRI